MSRVALVPVLLLAAGCAMLGSAAPRALADADARMAQGDYPAALAAYDAYLVQFPDDVAAGRVRAIRALMTELATARADRDRLTAREAQLSRESTTRDTELVKLRQDLAARQAEAARLQAEAARLKDDLEALKRTDLQMERRRR